MNTRTIEAQLKEIYKLIQQADLGKETSAALDAEIDKIHDDSSLICCFAGEFFSSVNRPYKILTSPKIDKEFIICLNKKESFEGKNGEKQITSLTNPKLFPGEVQIIGYEENHNIALRVADVEMKLSCVKDWLHKQIQEKQSLQKILTMKPNYSVPQPILPSVSALPAAMFSQPHSNVPLLISFSLKVDKPNQVSELTIKFPTKEMLEKLMSKIGQEANNIRKANSGDMIYFNAYEAHHKECAIVFPSMEVRNGIYEHLFPKNPKVAFTGVNVKGEYIIYVKNPNFASLNAKGASFSVPETLLPNANNIAGVGLKK